MSASGHDDDKSLSFGASPDYTLARLLLFMTPNQRNPLYHPQSYDTGVFMHHELSIVNFIVHVDYVP